MVSIDSSTIGIGLHYVRGAIDSSPSGNRVSWRNDTQAVFGMLTGCLVLSCLSCISLYWRTERDSSRGHLVYLYVRVLSKDPDTTKLVTGRALVLFVYWHTRGRGETPTNNGLTTAVDAWWIPAPNNCHLCLMMASVIFPSSCRRCLMMASLTLPPLESLPAMLDNGSPDPLRINAADAW